MSRDLTRPMQRGLLVPDQRVTLDPDDAAHTWVSTGARPGVPESQGEPRSLLVLKSSGEQDASARLIVQANRAGFPGERRRAGGYVYRDASQDDWRGWDVPNVLTGYEWVHRQVAPSLLVMQQAHMLRLHDGRVLLAARLAGLTGDVIRVRRYDPSTGIWSTTADVAPPSSSLVGTGEQLAGQAWPCLVQLPDGRVLLFAWVGDGSTYLQLSQWYSVDAGETWTRAARWCLDEEIAPGLVTGKTRVAYNAGQLLLVAAISTGALRSWASDDLGARFHVVDDTDAGVGGTSPSLIPLDGGAFRVMLVDGALDVRVARIASAWDPIDTATASNVGAAPDGESLDVEAWPDEDGTWYAAVSRAWEDAEENPITTASRVLVLRSLTLGSTWQLLGSPWPRGGVTQTAYELAAAETCGRSLLACRFTDESSGLGDASMLMLYLGGHSTITMPSASRSRRDVHQADWDVLWLPVDTPDVWGWALTTSGVSSGSLNVDGLAITTGSGGQRAYAEGGVLTGSGYEAVAVAELRVTSTGGTSYAGLSVWGGDTTAAYGAEVRVTTTGLSLHDAGGTGGQFGSTISQVMSHGYWQVMVAVGAGRARCWYREVAEDGEPEREWIEGPSGVPTGVSGSTDVGSVRIRHVSSVGGLTSGTWRWVGAVGLEPVVGLADGPTYPEELFSRAFSALPVRLPGGVVLEATDGPAYDGDTWHVEPRFEFGIELVDPLRYPSPRRQARTEITGAQVVYQLSTVAGEATLLDTSTWGVGVYGASTCDVQLHGWDPAAEEWAALTSGSSWVEGLEYERVGDAVTLDTTAAVPATTPTYIERDMLAGAVIDLGGGVLRRVARNTDGRWGAGTVRRPVLYLDPEYLTGSEPTSGTCRIGPAERGQVILVHGLDRYEKVRITYGQGYGSGVRVGTVVVGALLLFGREYSWGRVLETEPNVQMTTLRGGTRHTRIEGPPRRAVDFGWADGVITRPLWGEYAPDYVRAYTGGGPVATAADVGSMLEGLLRQLDGPHRPLVYLPAVPSDQVEARLLWPSAHLYGRWVGGIRREPYLGDELESEVERIASIRIEEEV